MRASQQSASVLRGFVSTVAVTWLVWTACMASSPGAAFAQDEASDPWRVMGLTSVGAPLRVTRRAELGQSTFAPVFVDGNVALVLPGRGRLRHGPLLGMSTNLSIDGGFYAPVDPLAQRAVLFGYLARYALTDDVFALSHAGLAWDLGGSDSAGVEISIGAAYRVLAGVGVFSALGGNVWGGEGGLNWMASLELGLFIDYEVLP